jgi:hypothetical protein
VEMSLDLCQDCIKRLLGEFIQFHGNAYFPDTPGNDHLEEP